MPASSCCAGSPASGRGCAGRHGLDADRSRAGSLRWPTSGTPLVEPFDLDQLSRESDAIFLAVPEGLSAEVAPVLADRGARVFDLSGAFRLRDAELRQRWYPHSPDVQPPAGLRADGAVPGGTPVGPSDRVRRLLSDRRRAGAASARRGGTAAAGHHHRRQVRHLGRRARRRPSARTFPRRTAACRRTAYSAIVTAPRSSRSSAYR